MVGALALFFPEVLGIGHMAMDRMLEGQVGLGLLLALVVMKIVATSLTLGSGGSGGVFVPSLFVGSALGGALGTAVARWAPFAHGGPGAYALVGMGALVAATSHAPLTGIVIMFELTGDYEIILPVMLACILSTVVASSLKEESIYTQKLKWKGITLRQGREETILRHLSVRDVLRREYRSFPEDAPLPGLLGEALGSPQTTFPVIGPAGELAGVIRVQDLHRALDDRSALEGVLMAADLATPSRTLHEDDTVEEALDQLTETGADLLPVVDGQEKLLGVVLASDVLERYSHELRKLRLASTLAQRRSFSIQTDGHGAGPWHAPGRDGRARGAARSDAAGDGAPRATRRRGAVRPQGAVPGAQARGPRRAPGGGRPHARDGGSVGASRVPRERRSPGRDARHALSVRGGGAAGAGLHAPAARAIHGASAPPVPERAQCSRIGTSMRSRSGSQAPPAGSASPHKSLSYNGL